MVTIIIVIGINSEEGAEDLIEKYLKSKINGI